MIHINNSVRIFPLPAFFSFAHLLLFLMVFLSFQGCGATQYNPYRIEKEQFFTQVKTIAILPLRHPDFIIGPEEIESRYETLISEKLQREGFAVIPSKEGKDQFNKFAEEVGGIFDPVTGKMDQAKYDVVNEHARRELIDRHNVDAFLSPSLVVVEAITKPGFLAPDLASWDGVEESVTDRLESSKDFIPVFIPFGVPQFVKIPALSLIIVISDTNGKLFYAHGGGVQLLYKWSKGDSKYISLKPIELFLDNSKDHRATKIALAPLTRMNPADTKPD